MEAREGDRREGTRARALAIARRVRANARGDVSGRHGTAELAAGAAILLAAGWSDPRDRQVREEADAIARELASSSGRRTYDLAALPEAGADARAAWAAALTALRDRMRPPAFELWIRPLRVVGLRDGRLGLAAPAELAAWIERRYGEAIAKAANVNEAAIVAYRDDADQGPSARKESTP